MKKSLQAERSRKYMIEALFILMSEKPYESITIKEITEKAGVARLTFYRHFESKDQLLESHFDEIFKQYLNEFEKNPNISIRDALCKSFYYWRKDIKVSRLLIEHDLSSLIFKVFKNELTQMLDLNIFPLKINDVQRNFIEGGLVTVMIEWSRDSQNKSPEEMADIILELINIKS